MSGTDIDKRKPQWSEKGKGRRSQDEKKRHPNDGTQPVRSIRELMAPLLLDQVKPGREGNRWRQTSTQQQLVKSLAKASELSQESSSTQEPQCSTARSKTELKSPARIVGTLGSTYVVLCPGRHFPIQGIQRNYPKTDSTNLELRSVPSESDQEVARDKDGRNKTMHLQDLSEP